MASLGTKKPIPRSIAVFGASGPIGGPLARQVRYRVGWLVADLFGLASVENAVEGAEGAAEKTLNSWIARGFVPFSSP